MVYYHGSNCVESPLLKEEKSPIAQKRIESSYFIMRHRQAVRQGTLTPPSQVRLLLAQLKTSHGGFRASVRGFCCLDGKKLCPGGKTLPGALFPFLLHGASCGPAPPQKAARPALSGPALSAPGCSRRLSMAPCPRPLLREPASRTGPWGSRRG